jgi:Ca2+/Na+ antiporter
MNFITYFFQTIPDLRLPDIIINVVGMLGALLVGYGVFLEAEKRQDIVFMLAGMCLFVYAIWLASPVTMIAMALFTLASTYEFIQIMRGKHHHVCYPDKGNQNKISNI